MKFKAKSGLIGLTTAMLLSLSSVTFAYHDHGPNLKFSNALAPLPAAGFTPSASTSTNLAVSLTAEAGYTGYNGTVWSNSDSNGGIFHASITVPVDGTLITTAAAATNVYTLQINDSTNVNGIATCSLVISDIDFTYSGTTLTESAEYKVSVNEAGTAAATATLGGCVSSTGSSTTTILPVLAAGDVVTISLAGTPVLSGTLAAATGHHH